MVDALTHMLREAGKLQKAGEAHGWDVKVTDTTDGQHGTETLRVDCVATRGQEVISIWWEDKKLLEAPTYQLAGREIKLRNASACVQQMSKKPDFEKAARKAKVRRRRGRDDFEDVKADDNTLPWKYFQDENHPDYIDPELLEDLGGLDKQILRACYARTIVYRNSLTNEVCTDVVLRSSDASLRKGNFNSTNYHISRSSSGREILNFIGVFGFRSVALDSILRVGTSDEAAERTRKHLLAVAAGDEKDQRKDSKKFWKKHG